MRWKQPFAAAALLAALAGCVGDVPTAAGPRDLQPAGPSLAMNATSSRVVGYFPYWYKGSLDAIPYGKFTHLVYAFADPTPTGGITLSGDSLKLKGVIQRAHAAGVPVLISFGGWSGSVDSNFEPMAADPPTAPPSSATSSRSSLTTGWTASTSTGNSPTPRPSRPASLP